MNESAAHTPDPQATDLPEHQLGRSMVEHEHVIHDDWPVEQKQNAAAHIDRLHGGRPIEQYGEP